MGRYGFLFTRLVNFGIKYVFLFFMSRVILAVVHTTLEHGLSCWWAVHHISVPCQNAWAAWCQVFFSTIENGLIIGLCYPTVKFSHRHGIESYYTIMVLTHSVPQNVGPYTRHGWNDILTSILSFKLLISEFINT